MNATMEKIGLTLLKKIHILVTRSELLITNQSIKQNVSIQDNTRSIMTAI